jgi:hypothetical protein
MVSKVVDQPKERLKMLLLLWKRKVQYFASLSDEKWTPSVLRMWPTNSTSSIPKEHFLGFNVILNSRSRMKTVRRRSMSSPSEVA